MGIAWKLTADFNNQRHLFSNTITTNYLIETYICSCGDTFFILKYSQQKLDYRCKTCNNKLYYDANHAINSIDDFLNKNKKMTIVYESKIQTNETDITVLCTTSIPTRIDFFNKKVIFSHKQLYSLSLKLNGDIEENYLIRLDQKLLLNIKENLTKYIEASDFFHLPKPNDEKLTLNMASFFLKNKHLKNFDFYYWDNINSLKKQELYINTALQEISNLPKAKSIKKAVYKNYVYQILHYKKFTFKFIKIFCKHIKDINILEKLLSLKFTKSIYQHTDEYKLNILMMFLTTQYTDKQILKLFSHYRIRINTEFFYHTMGLYMLAKESIKSNFTKVSCTPETLHGEFLRCFQVPSHKHIHNKVFHYSATDKNRCIQLDNYQIKLPKTGLELHRWSTILHNCITNYSQKITSRKSTIYGFFKNDKLLFIAEVSNDNIIEVAQKYNAKLTPNQNILLEKWHNLSLKGTIR